MKRTAGILLILTALLSSMATAQTYKYGPSEVTVYGTLLSAQGETPDGEKLTYPAIELVVPITVEATPGDELYEPTEKGVMLLHLVLSDKTMVEFKRFLGRRVAVSGNLFHSDNGHHQTDVLLSVKAISAAR